MKELSETKDEESLDNYLCMVAARKQNIFKEVENTATEVMYRCISCRSCQGCRNGARIEEVEPSLLMLMYKRISQLPPIENPHLKLGTSKEKVK